MAYKVPLPIIKVLHLLTHDMIPCHAFSCHWRLNPATYTRIVCVQWHATASGEMLWGKTTGFRSLIVRFY